MLCSFSVFSQDDVAMGKRATNWETRHGSLALKLTVLPDSLDKYHKDKYYFQVY